MPTILPFTLPATFEAIVPSPTPEALTLTGVAPTVTVTSPHVFGDSTSLFRIFIVPADARVVTVEAENREIALAFENRDIAVAAEESIHGDTVIDLKSEPVLGSMVISRNAAWKRQYALPRGFEFPAGTTAWVEVTDRDGAPLATLDGEVTTDNTKVRWREDYDAVQDIPAGANYEMFVSIPDDDHGDIKVEYGRVVRREAPFPAAPVSSSVYDSALYTDNVGTRATLGPFWVQKYGKTVMHDNTASSKPYGMGNDGILFDKSATHWYAPLRGDSQSVQVSLMKIGTGGSLTVVLCSNYAMTNWIGVKFDCAANTVRPVTGSTAGPTSMINQSTTVANTVAATPDTYTVRYNYPANAIALYKGVSLTPTFTWVDSTHVCQHGEGHRYIGAIYLGFLVTPGPQMSYWAAKDDL